MTWRRNSRIPLTSLIFALWLTLILARGGSYLFAVLPAFLPKIFYLEAWRIVGAGVLPQAVASLKLAALWVIRRNSEQF